MSSYPVLATIGFLTLGILAAWLSNKCFSLDNSGLYVSLFFAPILTYMVVSGQILEFKGFGVEAKFHEIASRKIDLSDTIKNSIAGKKHGTFQAMFGGGSEVAILSIQTIAKAGDSGRSDLAFNIGEQIAASIAQGTFELLVIVDDNKHVLGYFPRHWFLDLMSIADIHTSRGNDPHFDQYDHKSRERKLQKTYLWDILVKPKDRVDGWGKTRVLNTDATYLDAYQALTKESITAIPVVDESSRYVGIIEWKDVESNLFDVLLFPDKKEVDRSNTSNSAEAKRPEAGPTSN